jgi:hypothetical protein
MVWPGRSSNDLTGAHYQGKSGRTMLHVSTVTDVNKHGLDKATVRWLLWSGVGRRSRLGEVERCGL